LTATRAARRVRRRSTPSSTEIGFAAVGAAALLAGSFTMPLIPARGLTDRATVMLLTFAVGSLLAAVPALLFRGARGDWKGCVVWYGRGLIVLAILLPLGAARRGARERPSALLESLRSGQITIDRFVRAERAAAPGMFDQRILTNHERALRRSFPDGTFSHVRLAGVTDGAGWLRAHITYQGAFSVQGESVRTRGQLVIYYHPAGTAVVGAACTADDDRCDALESQLAAAEPALRARFGAADLDGVLPPAADCSVETIAVSNGEQASEVRACVYAPGLQLTLTRLDAAETIASLIAERSAGDELRRQRPLP
jgi:hypothetical protein